MYGYVTTSENQIHSNEPGQLIITLHNDNYGIENGTLTKLNLVWHKARNMGTAGMI